MERLEAAKTRSKNLAKSIGKGGKGTLITAVTGGGMYYVVGAAQERVEFLTSHPYATPLVLVGGGHFLKRKHHDMGTAMIAIGGYLGAEAYDQSSEDTSTDTTPPTTKGLGAGDAGAWGDPNWTAGEAGAMQGGLSRSDNGPTMGSAATSGQPGALGMGAPRTNAGDYTYSEAMGLQD